MHISNLKFFQFRNIADQELTFSSAINLIHGKNGQGKTNVIEAIHLLSATKSFRTTKAKELCSWGSKESSVHARVLVKDGDYDLGISIEQGKKTFFIAGKSTSAVDFVGRLLCVTFSPYDIELVKGAPALRRQFLDKHCVDLHPGLLQYIMHYTKALKSKLHLLKTNGATAQSLDAWDRVLADAAKAILKARRDFVHLLKRVLQDIYQQFASADGDILVQIKESFEEEEITAEALYRSFVEARPRDVSQRTVSVGPHRDDFDVTIAGKSSRLYASQGQSKSVALALKLSALKLLEEERKEKAIFLLDDVDSELDEDRLRKLYEMIQAGGRQVFVTGTEPRMNYLRDNSHIKIYRVEKGNFTAD